MTTPSNAESFGVLLDRLRQLSADRHRTIVGITGEPGAGKSTLAAALASALGEHAAVVPLDGFHLSNHVLDRLSLIDRKGSIDTFDLAGYASLLSRIRFDGHATIYAPTYNRDLEEAIAGWIAIGPRTTVIITEGIHLLADHRDATRARALIDELWYLDLPARTRVRRLVNRHVNHGKSELQANHWIAELDEVNAAAVRAARHRADLLIEVLDDRLWLDTGDN
jgi:pantothenate kinase